MTCTLKTLIVGAALLAPISAQSAFAEVSYSRMVDSGENVEIDYGPGQHGDIVGGGAFVVTGSGKSIERRYPDAAQVQAPQPGLVPMTVGSGESSTTVWVPAGTARAGLALVGLDSTLPAEVSSGSGLLAWLFGIASKRG